MNACLEIKKDPLTFVPLLFLSSLRIVIQSRSIEEGSECQRERERESEE